MLRVFAICGLFWLSSSTSPPCDKVWNVNLNDGYFAKQGHKELFADPKAYYDHPVLRKCHLEFVDLFQLGPPSGKKFTWITYMGDSINRALFYGLSTFFSGFLPQEDEDLVALSHRIFPLLDAHR